MCVIESVCVRYVYVCNIRMYNILCVVSLYTLGSSFQLMPHVVVLLSYMYIRIHAIGTCNFYPTVVYWKSRMDFCFSLYASAISHAQLLIEKKRKITLWPCYICTHFLRIKGGKAKSLH